MSLNPKSLALSMYLNLSAEQGTAMPVKTPIRMQVSQAFAEGGDAVLSAKDEGKRLPSRQPSRKVLFTARHKTIAEHKKNRNYPDMYDILLRKSPALSREAACDMLSRFFGKTPAHASDIFNQIARNDASFVNDRPYTLDVAETKIAEAAAYMRTRYRWVPLLELKKF